MLKVIEGEGPDPFSGTLITIIQDTIYSPADITILYDPFGSSYYFDLVNPSPRTSLGYLIPGFCLTDCPNAGSTPPNGPGMWLFSGYPDVLYIGGAAFYGYWGLSPSLFISGLSYSPLIEDNDYTHPSSPGDIVYYYINAEQDITNTLSSPVNVYTIVLVGAVYGSFSASPVYLPITYYVFSPPIVFSPGVTMTVSVTINFPVGTAIAVWW